MYTVLDTYMILIWRWDTYTYRESASMRNSAISWKMVAKCRSFTLHEKQAAVCVAEEIKNYEASRRFSLSKKLIRDWRKAEASKMWEWAHWDSRAIDMGVPPKFSELKKELFASIDESRCVGKAVVVLVLTKRPFSHDLLLRCRTTIVQCLSNNLSLRCLDLTH